MGDPMIPTTSVAELIEQLQAALDAGVTHIAVRRDGHPEGISWTVARVGDHEGDDALDSTGSRYLDATSAYAFGPLVDMARIAEDCGVKLETVYTWRHRGLLPEPDAILGGAPIWRADRIEEWAKETGRARR